MAKFCKKCGTALGSNEKFCTVCGTRTENNIIMHNNKPTYQATINPDNTTQMQVTVKEKKRSKMSKGKKAKIIFISIIAFILVLAISVAVLIFTGPAYGVVKELKSKDYSAAISEYESDVEDSFIQKILLKAFINNYDDKVIESFKNGDRDYDDACEALSALEEIGLGDMDGLIDEITKIRDANAAFEKASQYYKDGDYENAIKEYSKITDADSNYTEAQAKLDELYPRFAESIVNEANQLSAVGSYAEAISLINTSISILPSDSEYVTELNQAKASVLDLYKKDILDDVTALITEKNYVDAINLINNAIAVDDNEDFQNAKATAEKEYVKSVTATVQNHLDKEDYISASRVVNAALRVLNGNSELNALKTKVEKATPIYLLDVCKPYQTTDYKEYVNGETFNMGGKSFTNGFTLDTSWYDSNYAIFNIENKYSQLSFYTGHVDDTSGGNAKIRIYLDGILKEEIEVSDQDLPKKITIDTTGVNQLKIEATYAGGDYGFGNVIVK